MKKIIICLLFFLGVIPLKGEEMKKHPGWAIIATAVLPGGGQFYVENYARGLFFSTLQISLASMTVYEKMQERDYWHLYEQDKEQTTWAKYNKHKSRVKNLLWWDTGIWFFACADAFTDAHFYGFNEDVGVSVGFNQNRKTPNVEVIFRF